MKKFVLNIILFGLCLLSVNTIVFSIQYHIYLKPYGIIDIEYDTYLLGDSHGGVLNRFTEEYGVYNFCYGTDSYIDMLRKLKYLIRNSRVKRIIITLDENTLSPLKDNSNNLDRSVHFMIWKDYPISTITKVYLKYYIVLFNPKCRDIVSLYLKTKLLRQIRPNNNEEIKWDKLPAAARELESFRFVKRVFNYESKSELLSSALENIITLCEQNNIKILGIKYPLSKELIETIGDRGYSADSIFYNKGLKVYDFKSLYIDNDRYFRNIDHLNEIGGREFAKVIATIVINE